MPGGPHLREYHAAPISLSALSNSPRYTRGDAATRHMENPASKTDFEEAAFELEAAARMIEPYVIRLDAFLMFMEGRKWGDGLIPPEHRIAIADLYDVHQSGERTFLRYLHLYPKAKAEWISSTLQQFKLTTTEGLRAVLQEKYGVLRKYAEYAKARADLPPGKAAQAKTTNYFYGGTFMRDQYKDFTAASVGPHSTATSTNIQVWKNAASELDLPKLANSLSVLRSNLRDGAQTPENDEAIGHVAAAERAAQNGDGEKALSHLREAGKWAFEVATKIGESVAAAALKTALGFP